MEIKINNKSIIEEHRCFSFKDKNNNGEERIIFKCKECDYLRILNLKTGKTRLINDNWEVSHSGAYTEMDLPEINLN